MGDVAGVDAAPDVAHFEDLFLVVELLEDGLLENWMGGAGEDAGGVHVGVAGAGEAEVDDADDFVLVAHEDVAEIEVAVDEGGFLFGCFDIFVIFCEVGGVVAIVEFFEEFAEGVLGLFGGSGGVNGLEFFEEFGDGIGGGGDGGVGEVVDAVSEGVAFDFSVDGEGTLVLVVVESHAGGVEAGFPVDEVAKLGVFDDHFGPEGVSGEAEEEVPVVGGDFDDDVGPARDNLFDISDFVAF